LTQQITNRYTLSVKNASVDMIACACGLNKEDVLKIIRERGLVYTG